MLTYKNTSGKWSFWLKEYEEQLKGSGYKKYIQNTRGEDFAYWKTIVKNGKKIYQIGVLFYDFRKYTDRNIKSNYISVEYMCMLISSDRVEMSMYKDIGIIEFEKIAESFYTSIYELLQ